MGYTTEEIGWIDGFVVPFMVGKGVSDTLRQSYLRVHRHIEQNALDGADLVSIRRALNLLLPCFAGERESQGHLVRALATTNRLLKAQS